jgi:hypothetical protein
LTKNQTFVFYLFFRSFQCLPKSEKSNQLISSLTIDQEQKLSPHFIPTEITKSREQLSNSTEIPSQIKFTSNQNRNADKKLMISKLEADNR